MIEAAIIPLIPWLTEAWLWSKSIYIAIVSSTIYHWDKPNGFCEKVDRHGYDISGVFYCL
tara:strand:+ start:563 stop:742 length:180 start_codon:yes stop_codon:yes gene_type:complete